MEFGEKVLYHQIHHPHHLGRHFSAQLQYEQAWHEIGSGYYDIISPSCRRNLKGMCRETFLRLEQKDFEANSEKLGVLRGQISALEVKIGKLPADPADDVLKGDRNGWPSSP
jgi:hypothetical protein